MTKYCKTVGPIVHPWRQGSETVMNKFVPLHERSVLRPTNVREPKFNQSMFYSVNMSDSLTILHAKAYQFIKVCTHIKLKRIERFRKKR